MKYTLKFIFTIYQGLKNETERNEKKNQGPRNETKRNEKTWETKRNETKNKIWETKRKKRSFSNPATYYVLFIIMCDCIHILLWSIITFRDNANKERKKTNNQGFPQMI
jgi:hypothetical protein